MNELVVTIKQGDLRGVVTESVLGGTYISFKGIPYALPPVGDLRFKDPQPPQPWIGVRDASKEGPKCAQLDVFSKKIVGDDDCLYLNVSTTSLTGSRAVMVWIHGGAFIYGDGGYDLYSPDNLVGMDIVCVNINYRLGVLGFLHADHEAAPGNIGLKDQVAALKWVKENIAQFGGDPNNVTIFGESAGSASVHFHLISPLSKGLFHKAILQSGVVLNPWARTLRPIDILHDFVATLGKNITDPHEIVEYLRTIPAHRLIEFQNNFINIEKGAHIVFPFGPVVDDKSPEPFIPKSVYELVADGFDLPVIIGYNNAEGIVYRKSVYLPDEIVQMMYDQLNKNFEAVVPVDLNKKAPSKVAEIAREIRDVYFGEKQVTQDLVEEYVRYTGDLNFSIGTHQVVEIQRQKESPTYFYRFSYDSPKSIAKAVYQMQGKGAAHIEELFYLFHSTFIPEELKIKPGTTEAIVRDRLVRLWTDFAKTGNPTPSIDDLITAKWEPVTKTDKNYLEIDAQLFAGVNLEKKMWKTWQRIFAIADDQ